FPTADRGPPPAECASLPPVLRGIRVLIGLGAAAVVASGCGGASHLSASEFIKRINDEGVQIRLGPELSSTAGRRLYAVKLVRLPRQPPPPPGSEEAPTGSGSLYVFDDNSGAVKQFEACQRSGGLVCDRASNDAVVFESASLETQRLAV